MSNDAQPTEATHLIIAECTRGDLVESVHYGSFAVVDAQGTLLFSGGSPRDPFYARSSLKPMQLLAMMRLGLDLPADLLALATASHSGEVIHREGVLRLLQRFRLSASDLSTPKELPQHSGARAAWLRAGNEASSLTHNCSGKHAAMLATCRVNDWPLEGYLDPSHPLQQAIREEISNLVGEVPSSETVDGCGTPLFAYSLVGLAHAFAKLAAASADSNEHKIVRAIQEYPEMMSGSGRDDALVMEALPEIFTKGGAEGFQLVGVPRSAFGPIGIAIKVSDGNNRACLPALAAILERVDAHPGDHPGAHRDDVASFATSPIYGGGRVVGEVRAAKQLRQALGG